uniref:Uncharacterized protein n=1 Tax=Oryza brachyantha TaxID=4533 RepID=J3LLM3_ORYBR
MLVSLCNEIASCRSKISPHLLYLNKISMSKKTYTIKINSNNSKIKTTQQKPCTYLKQYGLRDELGCYHYVLPELRGYHLFPLHQEKTDRRTEPHPKLGRKTKWRSKETFACPSLRACYNASVLDY